MFTQFFTGLRPGEAIGPRRGSLDLRRGRLLVRASRTLGEDNPPKTKKSKRTITVRPEVVAVLRDMPQPLHLTADDFVFTTATGDRSTKNASSNSTGTALSARRRFGRRHHPPRVVDAAWLAVAPATLWFCTIVFTLLGPVRINNEVMGWDLQALRTDWKARRQRWDQLCAIRVFLLLGG